MVADSGPIAIIPARGGSQGLPGKNVRPLVGKPLIAWTIAAAKATPGLDLVAVSTDDLIIAEAAKDAGAQVIHRPAALATAGSPTVETIFHALESLGIPATSQRPLVLLQPTSPLRTATDITAALALFSEGKGDSLISVSSAPHPPEWLLTMKGEFLVPLLKGPEVGRRQEARTAYLPNGAIYIISVADLHRFRSLQGERLLPFLMPTERSVDIDTLQDFRLVEILLRGE